MSVFFEKYVFERVRCRRCSRKVMVLMEGGSAYRCNGCGNIVLVGKEVKESVVIGGRYRHKVRGTVMMCEKAKFNSQKEGIVLMVYEREFMRPKSGFMTVWRDTWARFHELNEWELIDDE